MTLAAGSRLGPYAILSVIGAGAPLGRESLIPTTVVLNWHAELGR